MYEILLKTIEKYQRVFSLSQVVLSGVAAGGQGGSCPPPPPGPVEPDRSSLWTEDFHYSKDLFSLDSVVLIVVTCTCLPFSWPGNRNNVVSTENTCLFTLIRGRFFGDISHDKC